VYARRAPSDVTPATRAEAALPAARAHPAYVREPAAPGTPPRRPAQRTPPFAEPKPRSRAGSAKKVAVKHACRRYTLEQRVEAVRSAIDEVRSLGYFHHLLAELERVAVEPLPQLEDFLPRWRALLERKVDRDREHDWDRDQDRWLREAVERLEGAGGLAKIARSTGRADDLRAWCRSLAEARDWKAALTAFEEAAGLVSDKEYARGELLDGAALAAQELGRKDLPKKLELAWRAEPTLVRLCRWLGTASTKAALRKRSKEALEACPKAASRQRALLQVLLGELAPAAKLLSAAKGLGWSDSDHPGHLMIAVFRRLLGATASVAEGPFADRLMGSGSFEPMLAGRDGPRLVTPELDQLLELSGGEATSPTAREVMVEAMRRAAEKHLEGVTTKKRRRHYDHAAWPIAICAEVDPSAKTASWVERIGAEYSRYPAFQRELSHHLRPR
jgi:hypothetical protein